MARLKINRFRYSSLTGRDRRSCSLQECLENKGECRRRSYKNWIVTVLLLVCLRYVYKYWFADGYEAVFDTTIVPISDPGDELLTTRKPPSLPEKHPPKPKQARTSTELLKYYKRKLPTMLIVDPAFLGESTTTDTDLKRCIINRYVGKYPVNMTRLELFELEDMFPTVERGGYYHPPNCSARQKVAIIVAFRSRDTSLAIFLHNIHPFLMKQKLEYQIFIIEQSGLDIFNKGRLYNVGYTEVSKLRKFECIVFHDVDLLPTNMEIQYGCPTLPRHMSSVVNDTEIKRNGQEYKFESLFGGVVSLTMEMIERVNGYSNVYFGWGGEDNDMLWRLRAVGYPIVSYNKTVGEYLVLPHNRAPINGFRHHLLATAVERYKTDGLSNLEYEVVSRSTYHLYTHIVVDINPKKQNISLWYTADKRH